MDLDAILEQRFKEFRESLRATGTVTGTSGTKVNLTVRGQAMTLPRLSSYSPVNGDVVIVDTTVPNAWLVLGKPA